MHWTPLSSPSPCDRVLQPFFFIVRRVLSFTVIRLFSLLTLLPLYLTVKLLRAAPHIIPRLHLLLYPDGWRKLIYSAYRYRDIELERTKAQLHGEYQFESSQLIKPSKDEIQKRANWFPCTEIFQVCGANICVVHEAPKVGRQNSGVKILLLHGNPSWSFMWRDVIDTLLIEGHEVFALDFLGHGLSDKPTCPSTITFSMHMHTLERCIQHFSLHDAIIVGHDWGGCIATSASATLLHPPRPIRMVLLNSFLPPRPSDISIHYYLLYLLWFLSTGILDGHIPESSIMRFMAPNATAAAIRGYEAPYASSGVRSKASVSRFSHIVPGFPDFFLFGIRYLPAWLAFEGLCGPDKFSDFAAQEMIATLNGDVRKVWKSCGEGGWKAMVVFGRQDPLLKDFKTVLEKLIDKEALVDAPWGGWINGAGHYPVEEKPIAVCEAIDTFVEKVN